MTKVLCSTHDFEDADDLEAAEFQAIISDILSIPEFRKLKAYTHHHSTTRYQHCMNVAWYTYLWCRRFHLNYVSATRGALLHDFFLYEWKYEQPIPGRHSEIHPLIALTNATKYVEIDEVMRDCILHHMWPLAQDRPETREGMIVQAADKYCASIELGTKPYFYMKPRVLHLLHAVTR